MPALLHSVVSPELVHHFADGRGPLLRRSHVERDCDHPGVIEFLDAGFQLVGQQIARRDEEAVLAQPLDDRRPLPTAAPVTKATRLPDVTTAPLDYRKAAGGQELATSATETPTTVRLDQLVVIQGRSELMG